MDIKENEVTTVNETHMQRVANALSIGADMESIHSMLIDSGLSEYGSYLAFCAGRMLYNDWQYSDTLRSY